MDDFKKTVKEVENETKTTIEQGLTTQEAEKEVKNKGKTNLRKCPKSHWQKSFYEVYLILLRLF